MTDVKEISLTRCFLGGDFGGTTDPVGWLPGIKNCSTDEKKSLPLCLKMTCTT